MTFDGYSQAMFNRTILAAVTLAISIAASAAKDQPKKEECPTLNHQEIENLLRRAPSCQRAIALFEICQFGSSGDVKPGRDSYQKMRRRLPERTKRCAKAGL